MAGDHLGASIIYFLIGEKFGRYKIKIMKKIISERKIKKRTSEIAKQITEDYKDKRDTPILLCVLKGSFIFYAELVKKIKIPIIHDFVRLASYGEKTTSGDLKFLIEPSVKIENKDIIIIEDIIDTGQTMQALVSYLYDEQVKSVRICTLLDKPSRRKHTIMINYTYTGFIIEDLFVVGYGLDYNEKYRNLPYIGILDPKKEEEGEK